ncbi:MAG: acetyl-CoA carboxylase biotin carboxyl carrier protein subunit [Oligoflexus sp.]
MEWLTKTEDQTHRVKIMAKPCFTQWTPVRVNEQEWEVCWNARLSCFFLRDPQNPGTESSLRLADFKASREAEQLSRQASVHGVYQNQSFSCQAEILLSAPGVGQRAASQQSMGCKIRSPMVGKVLAVKVEAGQSVLKGEELMVIEAMKMENKIFAPQAGIVDHVSAKEGQQVALGEELISLGAAKD